jgi:hypothetical protein
MNWLLFPTKADAVAAELRIQANMLAFIKQHIPQQHQEGWPLPAPNPERIAPMPVAAFLDGVGGTSADDLTPLLAPEVEW